MKALLEKLSAYNKTPEFNESSIPKGLLKTHQTKEGVWGKIVVLSGQLQYTINEPETEVVILDENHYGVIEPSILHEIMPLGEVRLYVEFYR